MYSDGFFNISGEHGFLPIKDPLEKLPEKYKELQYLIDELPNIKNTPGLIKELVRSLPIYKMNEDDIFIIQALFRAYAFLASMYLLEPSYQFYCKTGKYGKGENVLPFNIAIPFVKLSEKLNVYPWLDYHYCYSSGNYVKINKSGSLDWQNLKMACNFSGTPDECGFIMIHVYINELSPRLVGAVLNMKDGIYNYKELYDTLKLINIRRREMWKASRYERYNDFRIFIMGIKGNEEIFGDGVIYESCYDNKPQQFRGQTGAQDDIIPLMDIVTGIIQYYPENELTKYLLELREYRPKVVQNFFKDITELFKEDIKNKIENHDTLVYLLATIDQVYLFRNGHWQFVQKYIMENTKYPKATGGTPIVSWIPNQIGACLKAEKDLFDKINEDNLVETQYLYRELKNTYQSKVSLLENQIKELNDKTEYDVKLIYELNKKVGLEDINL